MAEKKGMVKKGKSKPAYKMYEGTKRKNKSCPKCGPGVSLAEHANRISCGKCGYTEMKQKTSA
jgi:ubiquitin-small subunit ribosomal protein S27Ae